MLLHTVVILDLLNVNPASAVQTMQFLLSRANDGIKRCPGKKKKSFRRYTRGLGPRLGVPQRGGPG